ncbi:hypothetical protein BHE74_00017397 [Ensete ventricosum]|nr:hypothetical protein BHE74_00017397 [Ensete ventricosum]
MAYGWPQVIPLESTGAAATSSSPSFDRIVYLKVINRHLLVVSPTHLELWSSSQVRYPRTPPTSPTFLFPDC